MTSPNKADLSEKKSRTVLICQLSLKVSHLKGLPWAILIDKTRMYVNPNPTHLNQTV